MSLLARQRQALILDRVRRARRRARRGSRPGARRVGHDGPARPRDRSTSSGLLEKVHGGATAIPGIALYRARLRLRSRRSSRSEKDAIAAAAARLVEPGMAIAISAGTTTYALARRLAGDVPGLTVVTNSVRVADVLYRSARRDQTVILTGGVRTPSEALVGPFAVAQLRTVHVDLVFMGVHGMDATAGLHLPQPARGRDRPGAHRGRPPARRRRRPHQVGGHRHRIDRPARPGGRAHLGRRPRPGRPGRRCGRPSASSCSWRSTDHLRSSCAGDRPSGAAPERRGRPCPLTPASRPDDATLEGSTASRTDGTTR